jgi:hypothetical protein
MASLQSTQINGYVLYATSTVGLAAYDVTVGTGATVKWALRRTDGTIVTTNQSAYVYRVKIVTTGTGTDTGTMFLAQNVDGVGWVVRTVHRDGVGSNHPYLFVDSDGLPKVTIDHPANYTVRVIVEETNGGNSGATYGVYGADAIIGYDGSGNTKIWTGSTLLFGANTVLHSGNYNSYSPTLTGGGASGTWGINITGNAATATNAGTLDGLDSLDFMRNYGMLNNGDVYVNFRVMRNNNSSSSNDGMYIGYGNSNSGVTRIFGGGATTGDMVKYSNYTYEPGSFRSPYFYDSDNTAYYIKASGTSNLYKLQVGNGNEILGLIGMGSSYFYGVGITSAYTAVYSHYQGNGVQLGYYNGTTFTPRLTVGNDGNVVASTSMRAPIFYDSDNTSYYLDPASTSNLNGLTTNGQTILGGQIYVSSTNSNTLNSGYGVNGSADIWINYRGYNDGFTQWRNFNIGDGKGNNILWADAANKRVSINNGQSASHTLHVAGTGFASSDFRAPIFYDSDNTGFYADFNATSVLNIVRVNALLSPNTSTVVAADSALPSAANSFIHTLALGPGGNDGHMLGMTWTSTSVYGAQIWVDTDPTNTMAFRSRSSAGVWTGWNTILHSSNYNSYSPTLTGGGASGTWGISITGTAAGETLSTVTGRGATTSTAVTFNGNVNVGTSASLLFGSQTRQMINLWGTQYGIGVQSSTTYFRSDSRFSWFRGGTHSDSQNDPGGGTVAMTLDGSSNLIVTTSVQAPRFYDSENTSYYLDPASSSVLRNIMIYPISAGWAEGIAFSMSATSTWGGLRWRRERANDDGNWYIGYTALDATDDLVFGANNGGTQINNILRLTKAGVVTNNGNQILHAGNYNSYAPTLTGGGASGTWSINITGSAGSLSNMNISQFTNNSGYITQTNALQPIYGNSGSFDLSTSGQHAWIRFSQGSWTNSPVAGNYSHVLSFNMASDNRTVQMYLGDVPGYLWWRPNQGGTWHPWERILTSNNYNSWAPTLTGGGASGTWGISITGSSASATNATNLYGLGTIQSTSTGTSYTQNYQVRENVGGTSNTNEIYAPQLAFHWAGVVASSIMMESSGRIAIRNNPGSGYESFIAYDVYGSNSMRAPIFYDSANTSYYLDLNSTTSIRTVGSWRADSSAWDGEFNGKIQYHSNHWYIQGADLFIYRNSGGSNVFTVSQGGTATATGDMRAPIFYDSADTTYFADLASTSTSIYTAGIIRSSGVQVKGSSGGGQIYPTMSNGGVSLYGGNNFTNGAYFTVTGIDYGSSPGAGSAEFVIRNTATSKFALFSYNGSTWTGRYGLFGSTGNVTIGDANTDIGYRLYVIGDIYATGNIIAYSDKRVKTNIREIENPLDRVLNSRGVLYDRTDTDDKNQIGFIAQELEEQFPELVSTSTDGRKGVLYPNMVAVLLEAMKEQQKQINELKSKLN